MAGLFFPPGPAAALAAPHPAQVFEVRLAVPDTTEGIQWPMPSQQEIHEILARRWFTRSIESRALGALSYPQAPKGSRRIRVVPHLLRFETESPGSKRNQLRYPRIPPKLPAVLRGEGGLVNNLVAVGARPRPRRICHLSLRTCLSNLAGGLDSDPRRDANRLRQSGVSEAAARLRRTVLYST